MAWREEEMRAESGSEARREPPVEEKWLSLG